MEDYNEFEKIEEYDSYRIKEIKDEIRNAFANIRFIEDTHTYVWEGKILESSSSFRHSMFENDFDSKNASFGKYKKNMKTNPKTKLTNEYYLKRWKLLGDEAAARGSRVHLYAETYPDLEEPSCDKERGVKAFYDALPENYVLLFHELQMFDSEFYKAGTADMILLNKNTGNIVIADWKTNDKNIFEVYKNKKLKGNFKAFRDNAYNKYSIQLSHYQYMLEKYTSFKVEDKWLIWLISRPNVRVEKDYTYQKVKSSSNSRFHRTYKCKNFKEKIGKALEANREYIVMNVKEADFSEQKFNFGKLKERMSLRKKTFKKLGKQNSFKNKFQSNTDNKSKSKSFDMSFDNDNNKRDKTFDFD